MDFNKEYIGCIIFEDDWYFGTSKMEIIIGYNFITQKYIVLHAYKRIARETELTTQRIFTKKEIDNIYNNEIETATIGDELIKKLNMTEIEKRKIKDALFNSTQKLEELKKVTIITKKYTISKNTLKRKY